ncbi:choice-of-anchor D domain-containing protein [Singulisphaera sp. Ch08]|uniref:Choice-of-anchor D domain-containing protein n=1 Tax=Singulisphaera sp. Ch08 TaxID=3120278 RepID=A0AAU7CHN9_9BACT
MPGTNRATNAPYTVSAGVTALGTVAVNQQLAPTGFTASDASWRELGIYTVTGDSLSVLMTDLADGYVIADAIYVERLQGPRVQTLAGLDHISDEIGVVDYGVATVGQPVEKVFTVRNMGTADLHLSGAIEVPTGYTLVADFGTRTLTPGAATNFTIRYDAAAGVASGRVAFDTDDPLHGRFGFTVAGVATRGRIVDNGDGGFTTSSGWTPTVSPGESFRGDGLFRAAGTGSATATWTFGSLSPGRYRIATTWLAGTNRATNTPYAIFEGSTSLGTSFVNQQLAPVDFTDAGSMWHELGIYTVSGNSLSVRVSDFANGYVVADAVFIERVQGPQVEVLNATVAIPDETGSFDFGTTWSGQPIEKTFTVRNTGTTDLHLTGAIELPTGYSLVTDFGSRTLMPGTSTNFTIRYDAVAGISSGQVAFDTDDSLLGRFSFAVTGSWRAWVVDNGDAGFATSGVWSTSPNTGFRGTSLFQAKNASGDATATWTFGDLAPGLYRLATTWASGSNRATNAPFKIHEGSTLLATVLVNQRESPNDFTELGAAWKALGYYSVTGNSLSVQLTNAANDYVYADAVAIERVQGPQIAVHVGSVELPDETGTIDFGLVAVGQTVLKTLTVRNLGTTDLHLNGLIELPPGFSLVTDFGTRTVPPGSSTNFSIRYDAAAGAASGQVRFATDDTRLDQFVFTVAGAATRGQIVDNGDAGFAVSGNWTAFAEGFLGDSLYQVSGVGMPTVTATWSFDNLAPGQYLLATTYHAAAHLASNALYTIRVGQTDSVSVVVNQQQVPSDFTDAGSSWRKLGYYTVTGGNIAVDLVSRVNYAVSADAVYLIRVEDGPTILSATATSHDRIQLTWTDTFTNELGFKVERSADGMTGWTLVTTTGPGATSYVDTGLLENARYWYRVSATNAEKDSAPSVKVGELTPLEAPGNLVATFVSPTRIDLEWSSDFSYSTGYYQIEQSLDGQSNWVQLGSAAGNARSFVVNGALVGATIYHFRIRSLAYYSSSKSLYSNFDPLTTPAFPSPPMGASLTATTEGTITFGWADSAGEAEYRIERSPDGSNGWTQVGRAQANATTFTDGGLSENTSYVYRVFATNAAGDYSVPSNLVNARTLLATPTSLNPVVFSGSRIDLTWINNSSVESYYEIEQSPNGINGWWLVKSAPVNSTSVSVSGFLAGLTNYYFRVRARSPLGNDSAYSAPKSVMTPAFPTVPVGLTATALVEGTINLAWADSAGEAEYRIERSLNGTSGWTQVGTTGAGVVAFIDSSLSEYTRFYYRVIACNTAGVYYTPSATVNATTLLTSPNNVTPTVVSGSQINLNWTRQSTVVSSYFIEQSPDGTTDWKQIGETVANVTSYSASGPFIPSTTYYFRVRAFIKDFTSTYYSTYSAVIPALTFAYPLSPTAARAVGSSDSKITLTWDDVANETSYRVQRQDSDIWTTVGTLDANETTFLDTGLHEATQYNYRILASNAAGDAAPSAAQAVTLPSAPTNLVASAVSGTKIDLSWLTHSTVTTYFIEQSTNNGATWQPLRTLYGAGSNQYTATGPFNGSSAYSFRVRALGVGYSTYATKTVVTPAFAAVPSDVRATVASYSTITVSWDDAADESSYRVERRVGTGSWALLGTTLAGVTSFTDTGLSVGYRYDYRVIASNTEGDSSYSDSATVTILTPAAKDDSYAVGHDQALTIGAAIGVLTNDVDAYGYPMSAAIITQAGHGTVTLNPDGSFSYMPASGFFGTDSFNYRTNNGQVLSNNAKVTINVSSLSDGVGMSIQRAAGTTHEGTVATFSELATNVPTNSYSAKIDWGDGSPRTIGTVTINAGLVTVSGSHIYARAGTYTVTVPLIGASGSSATATTTAVIASAPIVTVPGSTFSVSPEADYRGVLGQFSVANAFGQASDFTAMINWGDGSPATVGGIFGSSGHYQVSGNHRYGSSASYTVTVTIQDNIGTTATLVATAKVINPIPSASGLALTAPANGPVSATVASFTLAPSASTVGYSAMIDWGDGCVTAGTISSTDVLGFYSVNGTHAYLTSNPTAILVTISDSQGHSVEAESRIQFTSSGGTRTGTGTGGVTYSMVNIASSAGLAFHGRVASFTDPNPAHAAESFSSTIDWGDGTTSVGTVVDNDSGGFDVIGSHTYSSANPRRTSSDGIQTLADTGDSLDGDDSNGVTVGVTSPSGAGFTASSVANTGDVPIALNVKSLIDTFKSPYPSDLPFQGVVATFSSANVEYTASDFTAKINWGDGTAEQAGKVSGNFTQGYKIETRHTFESYGTFDVAISILSPDGARTVESRQIEVVPPPPNLSGQIITSQDNWSPTVNVEWTGTVATIDKSGVFAGNPQSPNDYRVTIEWGDGSTSSGEIVPHSYITSQLNVQGSHTYREVGSYRVIVTLTDAAGHSVSAQSMAFVSGLTWQREQEPQAGVDFNEVDGYYTAAIRNVPFHQTRWFRYYDQYNDEFYKQIFNPIQWESVMATIDWGDGTKEDFPTADVLSILRYPEGAFFNYGSGFSHIFTEKGSFNVSLKVFDADGHSVTLNQSIVVSDPTLSLRVENAKLYENESSAIWTGGVIASFTQSNPMLMSSDFSAVIDWGDGTVGTGKVIGGTKDYEVVAAHTYSRSGAYFVRVIVASRDSGSSEATGRMLVLPTAPAEELATHPVRGEAQVGEVFSGPVATFTSMDGSSSANDFTVEIYWGNGYVSEGQVAEFNGVFTVTGDHTYIYTGDVQVIVNITKPDGKTIVVFSSIRVHYPPIEGTTATVQAPYGMIADNTPLVSLTGLRLYSANYYYNIDWGDGTYTPFNSRLVSIYGDSVIRGGHTTIRTAPTRLLCPSGLEIMSSVKHTLAALPHSPRSNFRCK